MLEYRFHKWLRGRACFKYKFRKSQPWMHTAFKPTLKEVTNMLIEDRDSTRHVKGALLDALESYDKYNKVIPQKVKPRFKYRDLIRQRRI